MPATIHIENLGKRFSAGRGSATEALREVTFRAGPGVTGVVGPNGAGKTTLFALLLGFLKPSAGEVRIDGLTPRRYLRENGAAYLPERFQLPGPWRVGHALRALARLEGLGGAARAAADAALERFDLAAHADNALDTLSHGLLQRVGLAQTFLAPRDLVVLDEPSEGLDPLWRIRLRELVTGLGAAGRTVLLASHDLAELERVASRVVVLEDGALRRILAIEPRAEARLAYRLVTGEGDVSVADFFDDAAADGERSWTVSVRDTGELSRRLEALLVAGGEVSLVEPTREPTLEERVRRTLSGEE